MISEKLKTGFIPDYGIDNMKRYEEKNKRVITLSEKECNVIRNLIENRVEKLENEKDKL